MNIKAQMRSLHQFISLPLKMIIITVITGAVIWMVLDHVMTYNLKELFHDQMVAEFDDHAAEDRLRFDTYLDKFRETQDLFTLESEFITYINSDAWVSGKGGPIKYHDHPPLWVPEKYMYGTSPRADYVIVFDRINNAREVLKLKGDAVPASMLTPDQALFDRALNKVWISVFDDMLYAVKFRNYQDANGKNTAGVLFVSVIDREFLNASLGGFHDEHLVAFSSVGRDPVVIISNDSNKMPAGTRLNSLSEHYVITGDRVFNENITDVKMKFLSFASLANMKLLTDTVITRVRQENFLIALVFVMVFAIMIYWIAHHLEKVTKSVSDFLKETFGVVPKGLSGGDQIHLLKEHFSHLTEEVIRSREIIKKQAEEQTRLIVKNAFNAIITTDVKGRIMTWNARAEAVFGWTFEEADNRMLYDLIIPLEHHEECRRTIKEIMMNGNRSVAKERVDITCRNKKGKEFSAEFSVSKAGSGAEYIYIYIIRDVTERIKSENQIRDLLGTLTKAKTEWEMTFDSVDELIILLDRDLNIVRCNKSFAEFTMKPGERLIGTKCEEFLLCGRDWIYGGEDGKLNEPMEKTEVQTRDGRWLYVSHFPLVDPVGEHYTIVVATDITELKNAQMTLIESKTELKERVGELEKFYDLAVNRELKMITLKKEIAKLKTENEKSSEKLRETLN
jgi:PAS domain S-box-containing protein